VDQKRALVTERRGGLRWMVDGKLDPETISGIPLTTQYGDSGMHDVALHPDYKNNGWVYISYVHSLGDGRTKDTPAMTRVIRGRVTGGLINKTSFDFQIHFTFPKEPGGVAAYFSIRQVIFI